MKKPMLQSGISGKKYRVENIDSPEALDAMMLVTENLSSCTAPR